MSFWFFVWLLCTELLALHRSYRPRVSLYVTAGRMPPPIVRAMAPIGHRFYG